MSAILNFFIGAWGLGSIAAAVVALVLVGVLGRAVPLWAWVAVVAALSLAIFAQRDAASSERLAHAKTLQQIAEKTAAAHQRVAAARDAWQRDFAAMDTRHHQELTHAQADNDRLRRAVRAGTASVRLKAAVCPDHGAVPEATTPGELEHAGTTLDQHVQQLVLDHRDAITAAERQIAYLQDYAARCAAAAVE